MNITKFRNSYLIDKSYRLTLLSVTLTALAPLIATLVDGLFSSNLLGNDGFDRGKRKPSIKRKMLKAMLNQKYLEHLLSRL